MNEKDTSVHLSANESNILGLNVGRCVSADFDDTQLAAQLVNGLYDICRLTVPAGDEQAVSKLEKTGIPYFYSGSITRYKTRIADLPEGRFIHDDLEYEQYDGTQNDLLLNLLIGTWGTYPIGYYRSPFLDKLVTKEQEIICVFEFYKKHNLQKDYPNNTIMFIRHKEHYVGFFALNIIGDRLESHIGGIVEPYRNDGYFFDMQEYIRRFCIRNNLTYFAFGARNENRRVNGIFQQFGYRAVDADNVFHLAPLLSFSQQGIEIRDALSVPNTGTADLYSEILAITMRNTESIRKTMAAGYTFRVHHLDKVIPGSYTLITTFPVISADEFMAVLKLVSADETLISYGYFQIQ
jgi:hypothetical protein